MNAANDQVEVWEAKDGWRWRRVDTDNGNIVSESGEGYVDRSYALEAAVELNPGIPCEVIFAEQDGPS